MGNIAAMTKAGAKILLNLNNSNHYYVGSTVEGIIYVEIEKQYVECTEPNLRLEGIEESEFEVRGEDSVSLIQEKVVILEKIIPIREFSNGRLTQGRFEFPFSIKLPSALAPTINLGNRLGKINYTLEVRLHRPGLIKWDVLHTVPIIIKKPLYHIEKTRKEFCGKVCTKVQFCCFNKGDIILAAMCDKNVLVSKDNIKVYYLLKNFSTTTIHGIDIKINERIFQKAKGLTNESITCKGTPYIPLTADRLIGSEQDRTTNAQEYLRRVNIEEEIMRNNKYVYINLSDLLPSYHGRLIDISHHLVMKLKLPMFTFEVCLSKEFPTYESFTTSSNTSTTTNSNNTTTVANMITENSMSVNTTNSTTNHDILCTPLSVVDSTPAISLPEIENNTHTISSSNINDTTTTVDILPTNNNNNDIQNDISGNVNKDPIMSMMKPKNAYLPSDWYTSDVIRADSVHIDIIGTTSNK